MEHSNLKRKDMRVVPSSFWSRPWNHPNCLPPQDYTQQIIKFFVESTFMAETENEAQVQNKLKQETSKLFRDFVFPELFPSQ